MSLGKAASNRAVRDRFSMFGAAFNAQAPNSRGQPDDVQLAPLLWYPCFIAIAVIDRGAEVRGLAACLMRAPSACLSRPRSRSDPSGVGADSLVNPLERRPQPGHPSSRVKLGVRKGSLLTVADGHA